MQCPQCGRTIADGLGVCPKCGNELSIVSELTVAETVETAGLTVDQDTKSAGNKTLSSITVDLPSGSAVGAALAPERTAEQPVAIKDFRPKFADVKRWAVFKELNHYQVLDLTLDAQDNDVRKRIKILKETLGKWAEAQDKVTQDVGSEGLNRLDDMETALLTNRREYDEQLRKEHHQSVISKLMDEVEAGAADGVVQWTEWIGLKEKARALGATIEELEDILSGFRSKGVLTGLKLPEVEREVRTLNELKDACGHRASLLVGPLWDESLEDWLNKGAEKPHLAEFVSKIREEYSHAKLSGAWLFLWEIGEKALVLETARGTDEHSSAESWVQGIESGDLKQASIDALRDRRLENWFDRAIGREDLGRQARQLREEQDEDLSKIVRAIRAKGSDPVFEWRDGTLAYSLGELAAQCDKNSDEAKAYLFDKSFERRLQELGKAPLATAVSAVRTKFKDAPRHGVEALIRELCKAAKINPYPILTVQQSVGFGKVIFGESQAKTIQIENRGRGQAWGTIKLRDNLPGLNVPGSFDLEGNSLDIGITLDTSNAVVGQYSTELTIQGDGLPEPSCVSITYEVVRLDLTIGRASIEMGRVPIGGKVREKFTITNNGRGRSLGRVRLEPELPGVAFPQEFSIGSDEVVEIHVYLDTVLVPPRKYAAVLVVTGDGFGDAFEVPLFFDVAPLEVKFDPPVVRLGKIMHGTKSSAVLRVSCTPEGGRLVGAPSGLQPLCNGLDVRGQLDGQQSEFEIQVDTSKLEPGRHFNLKLFFDTNIKTLEVPIEFRTSRLPNQVIAGRTIALCLGTGLVMYICRALLLNVESLNQWFFDYGSDSSLIIAAGAFGALVAVFALFAFRRFRVVMAIGRKLRSNTVKAKSLVNEIDKGDSVTSLGLDVDRGTSGVQEEVRPKRRRSVSK